MHTTFSCKGKIILLVEDDEANMEYLKVLLERTESDLVCAYSGNDLRDLYKRIDTFSMVLLDIRLPDANGWELAREIKMLRPDLPVIGQTAYAMASDKKKSEEAGCDGYISKPIGRSEFYQLISKFIHHS